MDFKQLQQAEECSRRKSHELTYCQSIIELSDPFQFQNVVILNSSKRIKLEKHEGNGGFREIRNFCQKNERIYHFVEYMNFFKTKEEQISYRQRMTAVVKPLHKKKPNIDFKAVKRLQFHVQAGMTADKFIQNYEEKSLLNSAEMQMAYENFLKLTCRNLSVQMGPTTNTTQLGKQFFFFITSNYKLLQYPEEENTELQDEQQTDWVKAFLECKAARLKKEKETEISKEFSGNRLITTIQKMPLIYSVDFQPEGNIISAVRSNSTESIIWQNSKDTINNSTFKNMPCSFSDEAPQTRNNLNHEDPNYFARIHNHTSTFAAYQALQTSEITISNEVISENIKQPRKYKTTKNPQQRTNNFYNLPRYFMMLILELLSPQNISSFEIPQGAASSIETLRINLRKIGRKSETTKSNFYNHTHYSCLFRLLLPEAIHGIPSFSLEKIIFEVDELESSFNRCYSNSLKLIVSSVVKLQLLAILELPLVQFIQLNAEEYPQEKIKIDYVKRVLEGIVKLNAGLPINRF